MKYNVGYFGNNESLKNKLIEYCSNNKSDVFNYMDINSMDSDLIDATSFNAIVFDTNLHQNENSNNIIINIIKSNPDIDVMPIISKGDNLSFDELTELENESALMKKHGINTIPYVIDTDREANIFMNTVFSTLSDKTIRNIEQIKNYKLGAKENMITALKKVVITLELKDPYTKDHSRRVANYSKQVAKKLGLDENTIKDIENSGWLHDIGKLAINDSVLMKPSRLTDKEFVHMKSHAAISGVLLNNIFDDGEFELVKDYSRHHHERFDGKGYPDGISGEDIPLGARILCLADSFDAMTTQRSYNRPKKLEDAIKDLQTNSGSQFDPNVANAFIELLRQEPTMLKETLGITVDEDGYIEVEHGPKIEKEKLNNKPSQLKTQQENYKF